VSDTVAVPRSLLVRLWYAPGGAALFMVIATIQGLTRAGYDPWHQAVSALSLGPGGWVQAGNFLLFGAVLLSTIPVWREMLAGGKGATAYPALTALLGASFVIVAFVPQDPAPGYDPAGLALQEPTVGGLFHLAIAGVAATCSIAGLFVMAARFAGDPHWRGWTAYTRVMALLMIVCIAIFGVWSRETTGLAGTFERVAVMIPPIWGFTFLRRLSAGTPFMVKRAQSSGLF
jgi:hypothetical protein